MHNQPLVKRLSRLQETNPTPLAFTFDPGSQQGHLVTIAQWSEAAATRLVNLRQTLRDQHPKNDLPTKSLRGRLELADQNNLRIDYRLGLGDPRSRVLIWSQIQEKDCAEALHNCMMGWLVNDFNALSSEATKLTLESLKQLVRERKAIETYTRVTTPFRWDASLGKTAKVTSATSYTDLADYVARYVEGKVIFPHLPALRRVVGGSLDHDPELMTEPVRFGSDERFSLVVRVRVFSYPGRPTPIVVIEFSKRVWASVLNTGSLSKRVSGYALPNESTRALKFTLIKVKDEAGKRLYRPDQDFEAIERRYFPEPVAVDVLLKEGHTFPNCRLLVGMKHGVGGRSTIKSGVPDLDKLNGFELLTQELQQIGLSPWQGLTRISTSTRPAPDYAQHWNKRASDQQSKLRQFDGWFEEARETIGACYGGQHHLVIGVQPGRGVEADALLVEEQLREILKDNVKITRVPIPSLVHGPKDSLPGQSLDPAARAALRTAEWEVFVKVIKQHEAETGRKVNGILIMAHEWYVSDAYPKGQHDDAVNIRAARIALAAGLEAPVQYLLPKEDVVDVPEQSASDHKNRDKVEKGFRNRLMIAWLDLAYKSQGLVKPVKLLAGIHNIYSLDDAPQSYPDRVMALGIVRRNTNPLLKNEPVFLPYAVELEVETGVCSASFAYEEPVTNSLTWTEMMPLPQALVALARLGPVRLTSERKDWRKQLTERSQVFIKERLSDLGQRSLRPLVMVDADTCRSVWPWLKDQEINPANVLLAGGSNAQAAWPHARFVRVRTDNSPKVLWGGQARGCIDETGEIVSYDAPKFADAELFQVADTINTHVFLSFGSNIRKKLVQGRSSYREASGMEQKRVDGKLRYRVAQMGRFRDAWATPTGVELFVVRASEDTPLRIASLVEWLRQCYAHFGAWTVQPAPLHFGKVLKEYVADYEIEEEEGEKE